MKRAFFFAIIVLFFYSFDSIRFKSESMHWLQFRGPNASGIAPENSDPPIHFSTDTNILWKTDMIPGWSSPCIVDDQIYLTGFNNKDSLLYTCAISRNEGKVLWRDSIKPNAYYAMHAINSYANPTVTSDGCRIFSSFMNYGLICYGLDGEKQWEYKHEVVADYYGSANSPIIHDSLVILKIDESEDPRIVALECETGDSIWTIRPNGNDWKYFGSIATPIIWQDLLIISGRRHLIAYKLANRDIKWWLPIPGGGIATPVIAENNLLINCYLQLGEKKLIGETDFSVIAGKVDLNNNGLLEQKEFNDSLFLFARPEIKDLPRSTLKMTDERLYSYFDEDKDNAFNESEWNAMWEIMKSYMEEHGMISVSLEGEGERSIAEINWKVNEDTPETPSPLVVHDNVFFIKNGGIVTVINRETGEVVFKNRIGAPGGYVSSPLLAANRIYTCSYNGTVSVLSGDDYKLLAQNKLNEKIGASPVAVDDVLYIRTDKNLYAFREQ